MYNMYIVSEYIDIWVRNHLRFVGSIVLDSYPLNQFFQFLFWIYVTNRTTMLNLYPPVIKQGVITRDSDHQHSIHISLIFHYNL